MEKTHNTVAARYELNRLVRTILIRHRADLRLIAVSCSARGVFLHGTLTKTTQPDYKPIEVDSIFEEIEKLAMVNDIEADLENWSISGTRSSGTWQVAPKRRRYQSSAVPADEPDYVIKHAENLTDVLDDINTTDEKER